MDNLIKVALINSDGDWYIIPHEKKEEFENEMEHMDELDTYSDEFEDACDNFARKWSKYATGGSICSGPQLYANLWSNQDEDEENIPNS